MTKCSKEDIKDLGKTYSYRELKICFINQDCNSKNFVCWCFF